MSVTDDAGRFRALAASRASAPRAELDARRLRAALVLRRVPAGAARADLRTASNMRVTWLHSSADSVTPRGRRLGSRARARRADCSRTSSCSRRATKPPRAARRASAATGAALIIEDPWDVEQKADIPARTRRCCSPARASRRSTSSPSCFIAGTRVRSSRSHAAACCRVRTAPSRAAPEGFVHALPSSLREVVRYVRELSANDPRGDKWRRAFTELRGIAPSLWRGWTVAESKRFLRHVRPFWDAHRHRLAPRVHAQASRARSRPGRLKIVRAASQASSSTCARTGCACRVRQATARARWTSRAS